MPSSSSSFPNGSQFQPTGLSIGQTLSSDTYITGKLSLLWSLKPSDNHLRFCISARYPLNTSNSDYITTQSSEREKWRFTFYLAPSATGLKPGQTARQAMEAEYKAMEAYMGVNLKISTDGLRVTKMDGKDLELEGTGSRMMWTEKRGKWTVFQETTQSSTTPSWLESDSDLPTSIAAFARTAQQGGPSNLRPISSHLPPQLSLRPSNSPTKRKRTVSPEKRSLAPAIKPSAPVRVKRTIDLVPGKHTAFTRLTSGFNDPAILRGSSSIGDALGGSSSSSLDTAPQQQPPPPEVLVAEESIQFQPVPAPPPAQQQTVMGPAIPMPPVRQRPTATPAEIRAAAEAAARLQGAKRVEQEQAKQRAQQEAAAVLTRGLDADGVVLTPLKDLRNGPTYNVIGVVVDVKPINPPSATRPDPILSVVITDPSIYKESGSDAEDMVISIFRKKAADLPADLQRGTPIVFRGIRSGMFKDKIKGNLYSGSGGWATVHNNQPLYGSGGRDFTLQKAEIDRLAELEQWWTRTTGKTRDSSGRRQSGNLAASGTTKATLLGQVGPNQFFDAAFKIIHVHSGQQMSFEIYATDGSVSSSTPRNFHNIAYADTPSNAIFCINIPDKPLDNEEHFYKAGNIIRLGNLRTKTYKGELEITWSNRVTEAQSSQRFRDKRPRLLAQDDPESIMIEERLTALQQSNRNGTGRNPSPQKAYDAGNSYVSTRPETKPSSSVIGPVAPAASTSNLPVARPPYDVVTAAAVSPVVPEDIPTATHLFTIFTDPIDHQLRTLAYVMSNRTFPNKFRIRARVKDVRPRGMPGNSSFVQKHCGHCKRAIAKTLFCQSCQDTNMKHAAWRYRFIAILEDEVSTLPILISDYEAERFLPPLPPISASTNPNDHKKTERQIADVTKNVMNVLQGARMDGIRPRPWIDWTIQSVIVSAPKGYVGKKGEKGVVVYKAFGMQAN